MRRIVSTAGAIICFAALAAALAAPSLARPNALYVLRSGGWKITFSLPGSSPVVDRVERCRQRLRAPRLTYLTVVLDNRRGKTELDGPSVDVVTKAGRRVTFDDVGRWINDDNWLGRSPVGSALYEECGVRLFNGVINRDHALPGQKTAYVMAAHGALRPSSVRHFFVRHPQTLELVRLAPGG